MQTKSKARRTDIHVISYTCRYCMHKKTMGYKKKTVCTFRSWGRDRVQCQMLLHRFIAVVCIFSTRKTETRCNKSGSELCMRVCVCVLYVCMTYVFGFILFCSSIRPSRVQQQLTQFAAHRLFSHKTHLRSKKNAFRHHIIKSVNSLQI